MGVGAWLASLTLFHKILFIYSLCLAVFALIWIVMILGMPYYSDYIESLKHFKGNDAADKQELDLLFKRQQAKARAEVEAKKTALSAKRRAATAEQSDKKRD